MEEGQNILALMLSQNLTHLSFDVQLLLLVCNKCQLFISGHDLYENGWHSICYKIKMITYLTIIWLLLISISQTCDDSYSFDHSFCVFYMHANDSSCSSFIFDQCTWGECVSSYTDLDGNTQCSEEATFSGWKICTDHCCDYSVDYAQNYDSLQQCQEYLDGQLKKALIIGLSVTGGIILIAIFIIYCCLRFSCRDCFSQFCQKIFYILTCGCCRNRSDQPPKLEERSNQIMMDPHIRYMQLDWRLEDLKSFKLNNICSICLDENPSLQLQCLHIYHRKCIIDWLKRKVECVLCRSTMINQVKIYCQRCFNSYYETQLMQNIPTLEFTPQICQNCSGVQE